MTDIIHPKDIGVSEENLSNFFEAFRGRKIGEWPEILSDAKCAVHSRYEVITLQFYQMKNRKEFMQFRDSNADLAIRYVGPHTIWNGTIVGETPHLEIYANDPSLDLSAIVESLKNDIFMHVIAGKCPLQ